MELKCLAVGNALLVNGRVLDLNSGLKTCRTAENVRTGPAQRSTDALRDPSNMVQGVNLIFLDLFPFPAPSNRTRPFSFFRSMMLSFARRLFPAVASAQRFSTTARVCVTAGQTQPAPEASEGEQHIINKLTEKFAPSQLQVQDVSGRLPVRRTVF